MSEPIVQEHDWKPTGARIPGHTCTACGILSFSGPIPTTRCPGRVTINIRIDAEYTLRVGDVWPDGDYPDEITAEAVAAVMREQRGELSTGWSLAPEYFVSIGRAGPEVQV